MTRGGRAKTRDAPERRCAATGVRGETYGLIRFVLDPEGVVTPDLAEKLPGRGVWISADHAAMRRAIAKNAFARAAKAPAQVPENLLETLEQLLLRRVIDAISLARKAGLAVGGFEKTKAALPWATALVQARDVAPNAQSKMRRLADGLPEISTLESQELGAAFGRPFLMHAALGSGGASDRAVREAARLSGLRGEGEASPGARA